MSKQNHSKCPGAFLVKATPSISFYCVKHNVVFGGAWVSGIRPMPKTDALDTELEKLTETNQGECDISKYTTGALDTELEQLEVDAILSPNKPLTRLAIYKWLDKHDITIHSDEVVKLDNLIQALTQTHYLSREAVREAIPGTAIIDWDDFKSKEEEHEYFGYCKAVEDFKQALGLEDTQE